LLLVLAFACCCAPNNTARQRDYLAYTWLWCMECTLQISID